MRLAIIATAASALLVTAASAHVAPSRETVKTVFDEALPNAPGMRTIGQVVSYKPGGMTPPHHHAASAFITAYVLTGAIRTSVNGSPPRVYHQGEVWMEAPGALHGVSANASDTEPASLLAVFVLKDDHGPLTIPLDAHHH